MKTRAARSPALALALPLALLAGACALGPNYERPKVTTPPSFRFEGDPATAASIADLPWWKVFGDDALHALVSEALRNNFDLLIATSRVDQSRALAKAAGAQLLPAVNATSTGQYGNSFEGAATVAKPFWAVDATGTASWEIDVFGRLRRSAEAARAQYAASEEARRGVWVTVLAEVAQNYFQLLGLDLQRTIAIQTVSDREKTVDFFRIRSEGGIGTDLDVSRGDADLVGARATFVSLERQIALAENTISLLLGRAPGPVARTAVTTLPEPPTVPAGLPSQLLERRADVREAEANLVAANAQVGVATANLFPKFSLTAVGGIISSNLNFVAAHNPDGLWSVGGQVDWLAPILQGASLRDQLHAAKSAYEAVRTAYVKAVMNAFKDVADALVSLARLREQAGETQKQVDALARAVDIAKTQFEGGTATYLDVINAEEQLFPAQLDLAQVKTQELTAFVQLYRVLGGGWWLAE